MYDSEKTLREFFEKELIDSQSRLELAIDCAQLGTWDWHIPSGNVVYNDHWAEMLGYKLSEIDPHVNGWSSLLHPEDVDYTYETLTNNLTAKIDQYVNIHRLKTKNNKWKWVQARGRVVERDSEGKAIRHTGVVFDYHETKTQELDLEKRVNERTLELEKSKQQLQNLLQMAPEGIIITNEFGIVQIFSNGAERLFGYSQKEIIGHSIKRLMPPEFRKNHEGYIDALKNINAPHVNMGKLGEISGLRKDDSSFPAKASVSKLIQNGETRFTIIIHDITELKRTQGNLLTAYEQAQLANKAKSEFLANMSHELRTPLNGVLGFAQIISGQFFGPVGNQKYLDYAAAIEQSGQHLLEIITDILDLSKIEAGHIKFRPEEFDLLGVIDECKILFQKNFTRQNKEFKIKIQKNLPLLWADRRRIKQVLLNLLSNASKFTNRKGEITLKLNHHIKNGLKICISDNGIGIPKDDLETITKPFTQAHGDAHTRGHQQGTGLGLALVKSFVEGQNGMLNISSIVGKGTEVSITFPPSIFIRDNK